MPSECCPRQRNVVVHLSGLWISPVVAIARVGPWGAGLCTCPAPHKLRDVIVVLNCEQQVDASCFENIAGPLVVRVYLHDGLLLLEASWLKVYSYNSVVPRQQMNTLVHPCFFFHVNLLWALRLAMFV